MLNVASKLGLVQLPQLMYLSSCPSVWVKNYLIKVSIHVYATLCSQRGASEADPGSARLYLPSAVVSHLFVPVLLYNTAEGKRVTIMWTDVSARVKNCCGKCPF